MTHQWKVGDACVCVDAGPCELGYSPVELEEGRIYTVYGVGVDPNGDAGLFLDELESKCFAGGYLAWRFRPLVNNGNRSEIIALIKSARPARERA